VGYDKAADFLKFKTYTWTALTMPITKPLLYASIVGTIDHELKAKGLTRTERDGDLAPTPAGGMEFGLNVAVGTPILSTYGGAPPTIDANMWTGASGPSNLMAAYVPEGTLALTFVDRSSNAQTKLSGPVRSLKSSISKTRRSPWSESTKRLPSCSNSSHPKERK